MRRARMIVVSVLAAVLLWGASLPAQSFRRAGTEFNARRAVSIPGGKNYSIVVAEFYHHGQITPDGRNVLVFGRNQEPAPRRILQLGPGDFCRLAFQTLKAQEVYEILYGGDPPKDEPPKWTCQDGLLLETRKFKSCDLASLASVRAAFAESQPYGADYVEAVQHSYNPFFLKPEPFLSRYSASLHIATAGTYGFLTSSQDCSFLLIDDKEVVSAPGRHGPAYQALRGSRKDVQLAAGPHKFEYYHAAAGTEAIMAAAWEISPADPKPAPAAIPGEVFHAGAVGHLPASSVSLRTTKLVPDFLLKIAGEVPLPDNDTPLVGVQFRDTSPPAVTMQGNPRWDFGDGQTSDKLNVDHVYLRPGLYTVKLTVRHGGRPVEMANRVYVDRPVLSPKDKPHALDEYLPILEGYDPRTLDAAALRQLVAAFEAKAAALAAQAEEETKKAEAAAEDPNRNPESAGKKPTKPAEPIAVQTPAEIQHYIEAAVAAGKAAFAADSTAQGAEDLHALAKVVGPMARDRLGDSQTAYDIWRGAAEKINVGDLKADCEAEAADIALNDLVDAAAAKKLLDAAAAHLGAAKTGSVAGKLKRVGGDYFAASGDGKAARRAYNEAEQAVASSRRYIEQTAWRGAHSRSTEEFIQQGQHDRAAAELRLWQSEFPSEKTDGYFTLLYARYWAGREKYDQAIAQAEQLHAIGPDSPYIDQVLFLAAQCEVKRGKVERALATLHGLVKDYPGSPLLPDVKKYIAQLESGDTGESKKPRKPR